MLDMISFNDIVATAYANATDPGIFGSAACAQAISAGHASIGLMDISHLHTLDNLHTVIARPFGQGLGDIDRISLSVFWQPHTANRIIDIQIGIA